MVRVKLVAAAPARETGTVNKAKVTTPMAWSQRRSIAAKFFSRFMVATAPTH
ncbi:MAG: hypothetical protein ACSLFJ_10180 [Immundisolibacter sp.]|uniref:hypothetical protein n=1 Tax=Immundisolibacter sp. TaxID=1934948 RepID=UPI003EDE84E1